MSKIETFEDLQELGVSVLHEQTHIARNKLELLLTKSFDELTRVQFMGFVSILEREYGIDLSFLREEYDQFVHAHPSTLVAKESVILQVNSRSKQMWVFGGIAAIIVLIAIASIVQGQLSVDPSQEVMQLSSADVKVVDQNTDVIVPLEINTTVVTPVVEANVSALKNESNVSMQPAENFENAVSIKPMTRAWVGMMDLTTGVKTQKITSKPIMIDRSKNTLYMFGHGRLKITTPEGKKTLKEKDAVWFIVEDGKLQQISEEQFSAKNNGTTW